MNFSFELTSRGHLKNRESIDLEFKSNFHYGSISLDINLLPLSVGILFGTIFRSFFIRSKMFTTFLPLSD
jgi:hypothetical protein